MDRHRIEIPIPKGRSRKEKRSNRSKVILKPNGANNTKPNLPWLYVSPSRLTGVAVTYSEHTGVRTVPPSSGHLV